MWAILVLTLHAFTGIEGHTAYDLGIFKTEDGCKAALAKAVPATLKPDDLRGFNDGYIRYACVRIVHAELFFEAK